MARRWRLSQAVRIVRFDIAAVENQAMARCYHHRAIAGQSRLSPGVLEPRRDSVDAFEHGRQKFYRRFFGTSQATEQHELNEA